MQIEDQVLAIINEVSTVKGKYSKNNWTLEEVWGPGTLAAVTRLADYEVWIYVPSEVDNPKDLSEYDGYYVEVMTPKGEVGDYELKQGKPNIDEIKRICKEYAEMPNELIDQISDIPEEFHALQVRWNQLNDLKVPHTAFATICPDLLEKVALYYIYSK